MPNDGLERLLAQLAAALARVLGYRAQGAEEQALAEIHRATLDLFGVARSKLLLLDACGALEVLRTPKVRDAAFRLLEEEASILRSQRRLRDADTLEAWLARTRAAAAAQGDDELETEPPDTPVNPTPTEGLERRGPAVVPSVRRFRLRIVDGGEVGRVFESSRDRIQLGSHALNDLLLNERTVSRFHCEVFVDDEGKAWVKDLGSRNGTVVDGVTVKEATLRSNSLLKLGRVSLRFELSEEKNRIAVSEHKSFGSLVGTSIAARSTFALMERAAASDVTVLLEGETGTGKSQAAESIHRLSTRHNHPFLVVDCGAIPANLLESELFGHEKGAFTGATTRRVGVFEEAKGGTVFLDEIGELPAELQPKMLRVLDAREIHRLGTNTYVPVDVRIIAATNRDLRAEVNATRFRSDLYYRLAVVKIALPPLRQRPEDIPAIAEKMVAALGVDARVRDSLKDKEFLAQLQRAAWPGNMRELRNHLERCVALQETLEPGLESEGMPTESPVAFNPRVPYPEARQRALEAFERAYVKALLELHKGKVSEAAESADIDRVHLYRLIKRHRLKDTHHPSKRRGEHMATTTAQFIWHELMTTDVKAALSFYSRLVSWTSKEMKGSGGPYHVLEAGGRGMGGMMQISKGQGGMRPGWVGYITSPNVDADTARLKKAGGTVHQPAQDIPEVGRFAPVSDPQGAGFILFKPTPPAGEPPPQATGVGSVGWNELHTTDGKAAFAFYSEMFNWQKGDAFDMGPMGTYQLFKTGADPVGGMMNRADLKAPPHWLYYFTVNGIDAALKRTKDNGGEVLNGPTEVPGGSWILQGRDPQGASFALISQMR